MTLNQLIIVSLLLLSGLESYAQQIPIGHIGPIQIGIGQNGPVIGIGGPRPYPGNPPPYPGDPGQPYPGQPPYGSGQVCLFTEPNFNGYSVCRDVGEGEFDLARLGLNDQISSIRIYGDASVTIYQNSNYGGARAEFLRDASLAGSGWDNQISSFVVNRGNGGGYPPPPPPPPYYPPQQDQVCFFKDSGFSGPSFCAYRGQRIANLGDGGGFWNDQISSIRIYGYARVQLFRDKNWSGLYTEVSSDQFNLGFIWDNQVSSIIVQ